MPRNDRITIRLTPRMLAQIQDEARRRKMSDDAYIVHAVTNYWADLRRERRWSENHAMTTRPENITDAHWPNMTGVSARDFAHIKMADIA
jgi:hypothetical protein